MSKRKTLSVVLMSLAALAAMLLMLVKINAHLCITLKTAAPSELDESMIYALDALMQPVAMDLTQSASADAVSSVSPTALTLPAECAYAFELTLPPEPAIPWCLYIPNGQNCLALVNGVLYSASREQEAILIPLSPGGHAQVRIGYTYAGDPNFRNRLVYLGAQRRMESIFRIGGYQRFFIIGISFALLLHCLSLYAGKPSEKCLLLLAFLAYSTSARTLWNALPALKHLQLSNLLLLGTVNLPGSPYTVDYNVSFLVLKLIIFLLRFSLITEFMSIRLGGISSRQICLASFAVVFVCCLLDFGYYPTQLWMLAMHGLEWVLLSRSLPRHKRESSVLLLAWLLTLSLRLFDTACVLGVISHGFIEAAFKIQGLIETFYTIAFVVVVNLKFASKFQEADALSHSLEEINHNLEKTVSERTASLTETCRQLNALQQSRTEFMSNIVHNLKSPLFSLYGYTDMVLDTIDSDPEQAKRFLQEINRNTAYARDLIDKLFLSIRLESRNIAFHPIPCLASQLLTQVVSTSLPNAEAKGIHLKVLPGDGDTPLSVDVLYMRQALQNIVDNAIRHSETGTSIRLSAQRLGDRLVIAIADEGDGIPPDRLPHIFERYYSHSKSSGLGLSITREIIAAHQGSISVKSRVNQGTTFTVELPVCVPALRADG